MLQEKIEIHSEIKQTNQQLLHLLFLRDFKSRQAKWAIKKPGCYLEWTWITTKYPHYQHGRHVGMLDSATQMPSVPKTSPQSLDSVFRCEGCFSYFLFFCVCAKKDEKLTRS